MEEPDSTDSSQKHADEKSEHRVGQTKALASKFSEVAVRVPTLYKNYFKFLPLKRISLSLGSQIEYELSPWSSRNWVSGIVMVNPVMVCLLSWGKLSLIQVIQGTHLKARCVFWNSSSSAGSGLLSFRSLVRAAAEVSA